MLIGRFNNAMDYQLLSTQLGLTVWAQGKILEQFLYTALDLDICPVEIQPLKILTRLA